MKKRSKSIFILIILNIYFFYIFTNQHTNTFNALDGNESFTATIPENYIKTSTTSLAPFVIDDSGSGDYTWAEAVQYSWCSGGGTWKYPYIIHDISIDASGAGHALQIRNSNKVFIVQNSRFANTSSSTWAIYLSDVSNGKIYNNNLEGNYGGIRMIGGQNNTIQKNIVKNTIFGIDSDNSDKNKIIDNLVENVINDGIRIIESIDNIVDKNTVINTSIGIMVTYDSQDTNITNNYAYFNRQYRAGISPRGINTYVSNNTMIENGLKFNGAISEISSAVIDTKNNINGKPVYFYKNEIGLGNDNFTNAGQLILYNCNNSFISNKDLSNGHAGIILKYSNNNTIIKNNMSKNFYGITTIFSHYNNISENIIKETIGYDFEESAGIFLQLSDNNIIQKNVIKNNTHTFPFFIHQVAGIHLERCHNISIYYNELTDNLYGIKENSGSNINITHNNITNNWYDGIYISGSNQTISSNNISNNLRNGIYLRGNNHTIDNNIVSSNLQDGFEIKNSDNNTIIKNDLISNGNGGVSLNGNSESNIFYLNYFIANNINAIDNGSYNKWDNGDIGNFWDNYTGPDEDSNGRGDIPYNISGLANNKDFFPIFISPPQIFINSPELCNFFNASTPSYNIYYSTVFLDKLYYTINFSSTKYYFTENNTLDPSGWASVADGNITLTFYIKDIFNRINSSSTCIIKDTKNPIITITRPNPNQLFGKNAPSFIINIDEINLDSIWYSFDNGLTKFLILNNDTFDQSAWQSKWDSLAHGDSLLIKFYANDSVGNIGVESIIVLIDKPSDRQSPPDDLFISIIILLTIGSTIGIGTILLYKKYNHFSKKSKSKGFSRKLESDLKPDFNLINREWLITPIESTRKVPEIEARPAILSDKCPICNQILKKKSNLCKKCGAHFY